MRLVYKIPQGEVTMKYTDFIVKKVDLTTNTILYRETIVVKDKDISGAWLEAKRKFNHLEEEVLSDDNAHSYKKISEDSFTYETNGHFILCYNMAFI